MQNEIKATVYLGILRESQQSFKTSVQFKTMDALEREIQFLKFLLPKIEELFDIEKPVDFSIDQRMNNILEKYTTKEDKRFDPRNYTMEERQAFVEVLIVDTKQAINQLNYTTKNKDYEFYFQRDCVVKALLNQCEVMFCGSLGGYADNQPSSTRASYSSRLNYVKQNYKQMTTESIS